MWASLLLLLVGSLRLKMHFVANQRVVSIAVGTVVAVSNEDAVQEWSLSNDEIQLVPVTGSRVLPGYSVAQLGGKECVGYADVMVGA